MAIFEKFINNNFEKATKSWHISFKFLDIHFMSIIPEYHAFIILLLVYIRDIKRIIPFVKKCYMIIKID